jgi:hypothetical protein
VTNLAAHLQLSKEEILAGLGDSAAYSARSLDRRVFGDDNYVEMGDLIGMEDRELEAITASVRV